MASEGKQRPLLQPPTLFERVVSSPVFGTGIVCLGIVSGLLGSIYPDDLKALVQSVLPLTPAIGVWLFLGSALATAIAVFSRQRVVDKRREIVQGRFDLAAEEIPDLIRTLPDPAFLTILGKLYQTHALLVPDLAELKQRTEGVQLILQGFATLARKFDGSEAGGRYAANLMVFVTGRDAEPWLALLKFFDGDPSKLAGLLVLPKEFAALADGADETLTEFALPVPIDMGASRDANGHGYRVLPGAPMAYHTGELEHFRNAAELAEWCESRCDLTSHVKAELRDYFASHASHIGGFLSTAICCPREPERVIGVLNVHWDSSYRLGSTHAAQLFKQATFPLQFVLAQLLDKMLTERAPLPASDQVPLSSDVRNLKKPA